IYEFLRQRRDIKGCSTVPADDQTGNQTASMGAKPLERSWSGSRIADTHTDAAKNTESNNQSGIAFHQPGQYTSCRKAEPSERGADFWPVLILYTSPCDHKYRKNDNAQGKRGGCFRISEKGPALIHAGHWLSCLLDIYQCLGPEAPGIKDSKAKVYCRTCEGDYPRLAWHFVVL